MAPKRPAKLAFTTQSHGRPACSDSMGELPRVGILHYTAPPVVGGVETVISEHARILREAGFFTRLIVGRGGDRGLAPGLELKRISSIDSEDADNLVLADVLETGRVPAELAAATDRLMVRLREAVQDIDILIVHNVLTMHFNLPLTAALHRLLDADGAPRLIAWTHDASWNDPLQRPHLHSGYPWSLLRRHRPDITYVVLTRERQAELARMFRCPPKELRVIPNGVHVKFWWNLSSEGEGIISRLGLLARDLVVLQPTRITQLKNLTMSMKIAAALRARQADFRLVVTGPPDPHDLAGRRLLERLLVLRRRLQLEDEVVFLSLLDADPGSPRTFRHDVVRDLYFASDIVLLPSTTEGFGIPLIEAGMIGRPVFCADIPAFREIGRDLTHRFRLDQDPGLVARRILSWSARDLSYRLRRRVRQDFTWRSIYQRYLRPLLLEGAPRSRPRA